MAPWKLTQSLQDNTSSSLRKVSERAKLDAEFHRLVAEPQLACDQSRGSLTGWHSQNWNNPHPKTVYGETTSEEAMSDNKSKRGAQDRSKVNLSEDYEVNYWTAKWKITPDQLRDAVEKAGSSSVEAVAKALGKSA